MTRQGTGAWVPRDDGGGTAGPGRRRLGKGRGRGCRRSRPGAPECVPAAWRRQRVKGGKRKHLRPIRHLLRGKACRLRRGEGCAERRPRTPSAAPSVGPQPSPSHLVTRPATPRPPHTSTPCQDTAAGERPRRRGRGGAGGSGEEGGGRGGREGAGGEAGWRREDGLTERL